MSSFSNLNGELANIESGQSASTAFTINLADSGVSATGGDTLSLSSKRTVRLIYCGDGVVEECDEDIAEQQRLEREEKERQREQQHKLDQEAKNLKWLPWMGYMVNKSASKSLEACDYMGEKLAWWLGITKPKFLYEIEEYNRIKQEEEEQNKDDIAEKIVVGEDGNAIYPQHQHLSSDKIDGVEMKLFSSYNDRRSSHHHQSQEPPQQQQQQQQQQREHFISQAKSEDSGFAKKF